MALSQKDTKVGASSKTKSSLTKTLLDNDLEATQSVPMLKRRKFVPKDVSQVVSKGSESNDHPAPTGDGVSEPNKSFWDDEFPHLVHGRTSNFSAADKVVLVKRPPTSMYEDLLRCLHQAEASSFFFGGAYGIVRAEELKMKNDLDAFEKEVKRLQFELTEFSKVRKTLKDNQSKLSDLETKLDELIPKVKGYETQVEGLTTRYQKLENEKEEITNQLCSTLKQGFQLALDQIKVLCNNVDISGADITKEVVDGQLVDIADEEE